MSELKPCPFCGGEAELRHDCDRIDNFPDGNVTWWQCEAKVICLKCMVYKGGYDFPADDINGRPSLIEKRCTDESNAVIKAWNTRARHKDNDTLMLSVNLLNEIAMRDVIVSSANFLLELKTHKMLNGKDEHYLENIEVTWFELDEAIQALQDGVNLTELYGGKV